MISFRVPTLRQADRGRALRALLIFAALIASVSVALPEPARVARTAHGAVTPVFGTTEAMNAARTTPEPILATTSTGLWLPPLDGSPDLTATYSLPDGPYRKGHRGIDLRAEQGSPVRSPTAGTVSFVGTVVDRAVVSIRVDEQTVLSIEPVAAAVRAGQRVAAGDVLGAVAEGGHCGSKCVHLGVRVGGEYVNPLRFMRPKPVLLPWEDRAIPASGPRVGLTVALGETLR